MTDPRHAHAEPGDPSSAIGLAIVLVRPQLAVNIGMTARAMANFGLSDLRVVAPRDGWPLPTEFQGAAEAAASNATGVLRKARSFATVREAIADLHHVYATTARERGQGKPVVSPEHAMRACAASASSAVSGVLFGPERTGLDNDEVVLADTVVTFPVSPAYGSLNLAQAVLLVSYEWFKAANGGTLPYTAVERSKPATKSDVLGFFEHLEGELTRTGYFRPEAKAPIMRRNLRNIFQRISLTEQDVRSLRGALVRLVEGPRLPGRRRERSPQQDRDGDVSPDDE